MHPLHCDDIVKIAASRYILSALERKTIIISTIRREESNRASLPVLHTMVNGLYIPLLKYSTPKPQTFPSIPFGFICFTNSTANPPASETVPLKMETCLKPW